MLYGTLLNREKTFRGERHAGRISPILRLSVGIVLLLFLVTLSDTLLLPGFLLMGLVPFILVRFICVPAGDNRIFRGAVFVAILVACFYVIGFSWICLVLTASVITTYILLQIPRLSDADDKILYNYMILFVTIFIIGAYLRGAVYKTSMLVEASELIQFHVESFDTAVDLSAESLHAEQAKELRQQWQTIRVYIPYYFYGTVFTLYMLIVFFTVRGMLYGIKGIPMPPLMKMRTREPYVFILILALIGEIIGRVYKFQTVLIISRSTLVVIGAFYFLIGFAIGLVLLERKKSGSMIAVVIPFLILVAILVNPLIGVIIGVLDIWFDFRKFKRPKEAVGQ